MKAQFLAKEYNQLTSQRNRLLYVVGVLGVVNILLAATVYFMVGKERIIVVPPVVSNDFWVATDSVSDSYLEQMTSFFSSLVLNVNPSNFSKRSDQLLQHVDPLSYARVKAEITEQEIDINRRALTSAFHPMSFKIDRKNLIVEVKGELRILSGNTAIGSGTPTYQIRYSNRNGKLYILDFKEVRNVQ